LARIGHDQEGKRVWKAGGVATRLVHIVVDAAAPGRLARFWATVLGWQIADEGADEVAVEPSGFIYPGLAALPLVFVPVPEGSEFCVLSPRGSR
jgi:hypothetical protein